MAKYEQQFKKQVVQFYLSGAAGFKSVGKRFGVGHATVRLWVNRYREHGDVGLGKKFSHYSSQFKLQVLEHIWRDELSYTQAVALYDLRGGTGVVSDWERRYHEGGIQALEPKARGRPKPMPIAPKVGPPDPSKGSDSRTIEQLRQDNAYLRAEVAYLKKLDALVRASKAIAPKKRKS